MQFNYVVDDNGCYDVISHGKNEGGYCSFIYRGTKKFLHRHVYEEMFGIIPKGLVVRHKCDNPSCVNPEHLELGTQFDNVRDMVERNRSAKGENHSQAKLTEEVVREIKQLIKKGMKNAEIWREFGKSFPRCTVSDIKNGRSWRHVQ